MKNLGLLVAGIAVVAACSMTTANDASAQCATCPTPVTAFSPVVINQFQTVPDDGWYLGKFVGRLGRRIFGTAPAPAANYTAAYPMTYAAAYPAYATAYAPAAVTPTFAASYAPTYAAAYAPAASTCCTQTTYRPVVMQPVVEQAACYAAPSCPTCEGVVTTSYSAAPASNCPTCSANYGSPVVQQYQQPQQAAAYEYSQPAAGPGPTTSAGPAPPRTFQDQPPQLEPTPAAGASTGDAASNWEPPQLFAPGDKQVKRPTTTVWNAVYEQPVRQAGAATQSVSRTQATAATSATSAKRPTITWGSGE